MSSRPCRLCRAPLTRTFVDLGVSPLANSYVTPDKKGDGEMFYPLHAFVCDACFLVQLEEFETPDAIFSHYAYLSGMSSIWLDHVDRYAATMVARFGLGPTSKVIEIASNDGSLLAGFQTRGVPVLGVEPARNIAALANQRGIPTEATFFGASAAALLRAAGHAADLMAANNVLAHVPDLHDFAEGFRVLLKPEGVATFEFPHLLETIRHKQFDTIYHEHFSYLSLGVVTRLLGEHGLRVFDVTALPVHGGSLRVFACHDGARHQTTGAVQEILEGETAAGLSSPDGYAGFAEQVTTVKADTLSALIAARRDGFLVCGYGAAAKGNTFLNYCGIGPDFVRVVADRAPTKQGTLLPGSRIPVVSPDAMLALKPDIVFILPWNIRAEIEDQLGAIRQWGGRFMTAIPTVRID